MWEVEILLPPAIYSILYIESEGRHHLPLFFSTFNPFHIQDASFVILITEIQKAKTIQNDRLAANKQAIPAYLLYIFLGGL